MGSLARSRSCKATYKVSRWRPREVAAATRPELRTNLRYRALREKEFCSNVNSVIRYSSLCLQRGVRARARKEEEVRYERKEWVKEGGGNGKVCKT